MKVRAKGDKPLGKATDSITTGQGALKTGLESLENIILRGKIEGNSVVLLNIFFGSLYSLLHCGS